MAGELPELIEALHKPLGAVIDIRVNWSATEGALDFDSILNGGGPKKLTPRRRHRLMIVAGRAAVAKILVVPHMTTPALGAMVMRYAAGRPGTGSEGDDRWCEAAHQVVSDARAQTLQWTSGLRDLEVT